MSDLDLSSPTSRSRALVLGGSVGGLLSGAGPLAAGALAHGDGKRRHGGEHRHHGKQQGSLPADAIQQIVQAQGTVTSGVLSIDLERKDIGDVAGPLGVRFTPAFEIDGALTFQPLGYESPRSTRAP